MKAYLTKRYGFPASHRLHSEALSEVENQRVYGKCSNPHGHGHNYALEVTISGPVDGRTGMVCNLADLDDCVRREVLEVFDHANLNVLPMFSGVVPTTENLCMEIYGRLRKGFTPATVERVKLEETAKNSFACGKELR